MEWDHSPDQILPNGNFRQAQISELRNLIDVVTAAASASRVVTILSLPVVFLFCTFPSCAGRLAWSEMAAKDELLELIRAAPVRALPALTLAVVRILKPAARPESRLPPVPRSKP